MQRGPDWVTPADEAILDDFATHGPDYVPLVANRIGAHLQYVEQRCELLREQGWIEQTTDETIYQLTDRARRYLDRNDGT